jgi:hypothetical protein
MSRYQLPPFPMPAYILFHAEYTRQLNAEFEAKFEWCEHDSIPALYVCGGDLVPAYNWRDSPLSACVDTISHVRPIERRDNLGYYGAFELRARLSENYWHEQLHPPPIEYIYRTRWDRLNTLLNLPSHQQPNQQSFSHIT